MSDLLKIGLLFGGLALLNRKKKPGIGKMHDRGTKEMIPCNNGRYSDSFPSPGSCSSNGGVNYEKVYKDYFMNRGVSLESVKINKNKVKIDFGTKTFHSLKKVDRAFDNNRNIENVKMKRFHSPGARYIRSLEVEISYKNNTAFLEDVMKKWRRSEG
ncbi:hypothetical protein [Aureispira sp. CCB-QB1]|uniref:hypothetical protein n=1 Tax=Aureispira sp. CCB-QB1 TaxID=1313421 RepID=UPI00069865DA|nr:hypothetical protein [Aureispira sp. CCB-QB1]